MLIKISPLAAQRASEKMSVTSLYKNPQKSKPQVDLAAFAARIGGRLMGYKQKSLYSAPCFRCGRGRAFFSTYGYFCRNCWTDVPLKEAARLLDRIGGRRAKGA